MSNSLALRIGRGPQPDPRLSPAHDAQPTRNSPPRNKPRRNNPSRNDQRSNRHTNNQHTSHGAPAAVLPSPLRTLGAATLGVLAGLAAVYLVASRLAGSLDAVAAIIAIFALTMSGPWVHARAETELGRMVAVALQSIAFGAALGGLLVMT